MPSSHRPCALYIVCMLFLFALGSSNRALALDVKPTMSTLMIEVGDEELCLYSIGKDHYEGVSMHYQVVEGGLDFDVYIRDPDGRVIYASFAGEHGLEDRVYFTTRSPQQHEYCIDNRPYSKAVKMIKMDIGLTSLKRWKRRIDPLDKVMQRSEGNFLGMHEDQILLRLREEVVKNSLDDVFHSLIRREMGETFIIVVVAVFNAVLILRLFKRQSL